MLWLYSLKSFVEQLNEIKVGDYGITSMENFTSTTTEITLKITTHGDVQVLTWMQYFKAIYLD